MKNIFKITTVVLLSIYLTLSPSNIFSHSFSKNTAMAVGNQVVEIILTHKGELKFETIKIKDDGTLDLDSRTGWLQYGGRIITHRFPNVTNGSNSSPGWTNISGYYGSEKPLAKYLRRGDTVDVRSNWLDQSSISGKVTYIGPSGANSCSFSSQDQPTYSIKYTRKDVSPNINSTANIRWNGFMWEGVPAYWDFTLNKPHDLGSNYDSFIAQTRPDGKIISKIMTDGDFIQYVPGDGQWYEGTVTSDPCPLTNLEGEGGGGTNPNPSPDVYCSDGSRATFKEGKYYCPPSGNTSPPTGGGGGGGGGTLIEIPRFDYNHSSSNTNTNINQSTTGGKDLGKVTDNTKDVMLQATLTNVPSSGIVYISGDGFQPQMLVQYKKDSGLVPSGTEEENLVKKFFKDNSINVIVNAIDLNIVDIKDKTIDDFKTNYTSCQSDVNKGIECTTIKDSQGIKDLNNFRIKKPGRYLFTAYLTSGAEKYLLYKVIDARSGSEFTGLPIKNRMTAIVENKNLKEKSKTILHDFDNLKFTFSTQKEESMKVPSINNSITNRIIIGSTDKGVKMYNNDLTHASLSDNSLDEAPITDIIEIDGTTKVALTSNKKGAYIIDTSTGKIAKIGTLLSENVQSILKLNNLYYFSFDNAIGVYYIDSTNTGHLRDSITSSDIFGTNVKLGEMNLIGGKILINTHHESGYNKMAIVSKF